MTDHKDHVIEVSRSAYIEGSGSLWHLKAVCGVDGKNRREVRMSGKRLFLFYKKLIKMQSGLNNELSFLFVCR